MIALLKRKTNKLYDGNEKVIQDKPVILQNI